MSTPLPMVENFSLNGVEIPVTPTLLLCSNAPNLTLPSLVFTNAYQVLGNANANSSNLILVGSYSNWNCKPPKATPFVSIAIGI